jgi:lipopolysaccharide export system protein LptA
MKLYIVWICIMGQLFSVTAIAQQKKDDKILIDVLHNNSLVHVETDSGDVFKFIGEVQFRQGTDLIYCDSAYLYKSNNNIEAFGNVRIVQQGGTEGESDYMRYTGSNKMAYMKGNVKLTDGKNTLWTEDLTYDVGNKYGVYSQGGTLQSDSTTVSSDEGNYNAKTKYARFIHNVLVNQPHTEITSDDLGYYTETDIIEFYSCSVVTNDKAVLHTCDGSYDSKNEVAHFKGRSSIYNEGQYIEADTINYSKITGMGEAAGKAIIIDSERRSTMYCGHAWYNEKKKQMLAIIKPVLKQVRDNDSLYIRADTFYSFPIPKPEDSIVQYKTVKVKKGRKEVEMKVVDSTTTALERDSTRKSYFIGFHHVLIFSDSLQGRCDSISYSQQDSIVRMMYDPIAWSRKSQVNGDTILLYSDSSSLKKMYVPKRAFVVSQSGPDKAEMYDQVQGETITANFVKGEMHDMLATPDAQSIYYSKDDDGAYLGVVEAKSDTMKVFFKNGEVDKILLINKPHQVFTPLEKANIPGLRLDRFMWKPELRPKSKEELFE